MPKRQRLDDDDNETLHRLSTALDVALGASVALATTTSFVAKPSPNIAAVYFKLGENLGLLAQPTTATPTNHTATIPTDHTATIPTATIPADPALSPPLLTIDSGSDVTMKHPELRHFRFSIREFALSVLPVFHQIISWIYEDHFARGSRLDYPRTWRKDRKFRKNLSKNIIHIIQSEYPDVRSMPETGWGRHHRPNYEKDRRNCREIMVNADLVETTSKILSGRAHNLSPDTSCIVKFLYIMTEMHELMHYLITKTLAFMDELTPSLPHTGGHYNSKTPSWGESGYQLEVMMFGFIPVAVWKEGSTRVKDIQRLDGYFHFRGKRKYYSLSDDRFITHLYSFIEGVENGTLKPTDFPLHRSTARLNYADSMGHREYRARGFGYNDPKGDYEDHPPVGLDIRHPCVITSAEEARRITMGRR